MIRHLLALFLLLTGLSAIAAEPARPASIFLIASRDLQDPNFRESVVLVTQHGGGGPVGVIINRPTRIPVQQLFPDVERPGAQDDRVFFGGPVSRRMLVFVFRSTTPPKDAIAVLDGVYMSLNQELLREMLKNPKPVQDLRVYAGYSGWAPGQLEVEIARGGWHLSPADAQAIFGRNPDTLWPELIRRATAKSVKAPPDKPLAFAALR